MTALFMHCALAVITFNAAPLDGFSVSPVYPFSGAVQSSWRACDLNGDGAQDWLAPQGVYLQRDGQYGREGFVPFNSPAGSALLDLLGDVLYAWDNRGLTLYQLKGVNWVEISSYAIQDIKFEEHASLFGSSQLSRYLYDLNGDGIPEFVSLAESGLAIFTLVDDAYQPAGNFDVLPPMSLVPLESVALWPAGERVIQIPQRHRFARVWVEADRICALNWALSDEGKRRFTLNTHALSLGDAGSYALSPVETWQSQWLPQNAMPCRLNNDNTLDFAGVELQIANGGVMPQPITHAWATLDGGATLHTRRGAAAYRFRQHSNFTDVNGDGKLDFLIETPDIFQHGLRETLSRFSTRKYVRHSIDVYFQTDSGFEKNPSISHEVKIHFEEAPIKASPDFEAWLAGRRVSLSGDINGDRRADLVVLENPKRLAVYTATSQGFANEPSAVLALEEGQSFSVMDVNGDKRADIIVHAARGDIESPPIVHYSGGS